MFGFHAEPPRRFPFSFSCRKRAIGGGGCRESEQGHVGFQVAWHVVVGICSTVAGTSLRRFSGLCDRPVFAGGRCRKKFLITHRKIKT
jgi:hypothetical protein